MFEKFTDRARRAIVIANEDARITGWNHIDDAHILNGVIHEAEGGGALALAAAGVTLDAVHRHIGPGPGAPPSHLPFTPAARDALDRTRRVALRLGHNYIGTEHLVIGLVEQGTLDPYLDADARAALVADATQRVGPPNVTDTYAPPAPPPRATTNGTVSEAVTARGFTPAQWLAVAGAVCTGVSNLLHNRADQTAPDSAVLVELPDPLLDLLNQALDGTGFRVVNDASHVRPDERALSFDLSALNG